MLLQVAITISIHVDSKTTSSDVDEDPAHQKDLVVVFGLDPFYLAVVVQQMQD